MARRLLRWECRPPPPPSHRRRCATAQGHIAKIFSEMFGVSIGYQGKIVSNLARVRMDTVVETANDNHLRPWMWMLDVRRRSLPPCPCAVCDARQLSPCGVPIHSKRAFLRHLSRRSCTGRC